MDKVRTYLREFCGAMASGKMFPPQHPQFRGILVKACNSLTEILQDQEELIIGIVDEELIYENQVLFDLSAMLKSFIIAAQKKGIEKIHFSRGVKEEELALFVYYLISKKETAGNIQDYFTRLGIQHIKVSKLTTPMEERKKEFVAEVHIYENTMSELSQQLQKIISGSATANIYMDLKFVIFSIMEDFAGNYGEFALLFEDKGIDHALAHSFNSAVLSVHFTQGLGFKQEDILDIGIASLLHDIGGMYLSQDKTHTANQGDAQGIMPYATLLGARMLLRYEEYLNILPVVVACEYFLKSGSNPFAGGLVTLKPHLASQIVAISDYYDTNHLALSREEGYSPKALYQQMTREQNRCWSEELLGEFFKITGVWPTGSLVELEGGHIAVVREQNRRDIFSPKVEVIEPEEQKGFVDLRKGQAAIKKFLNPLSAGRPYLKSI